MLQLKPSPSAFAINYRFGAVLLISWGPVYCELRIEAVGWNLYFDGSNTLQLREVERDQDAVRL
jgi:hypothetical protein